MAPCTKASSSTSVLLRISFISANDSSLASTTRLAPRFSQVFTAAQLVVLAWVLTCSGIAGIVSRATDQTPRSEISRASAPVSCRLRRYSGRAVRSSLWAKILTVT